jgi:hypothetical protein
MGSKDNRADFGRVPIMVEEGNENDDKKCFSFNSVEKSRSLV